MKLTDREIETLRAVAKTGCCRQAAKDMGRKVSTINAHMLSIYRKLDVDNKTLAVIEGIKAGLVDVQ